eukprot:9772-Heterococcus_DN1.PRE.1
MLYFAFALLLAALPAPEPKRELAALWDGHVGSTMLISSSAPLAASAASGGSRGAPFCVMLGMAICPPSIVMSILEPPFMVSTKGWLSSLRTPASPQVLVSSAATVSLMML